MKEYNLFSVNSQTGEIEFEITPTATPDITPDVTSEITPEVGDVSGNDVPESTVEGDILDDPEASPEVSLEVTPEVSPDIPVPVLPVTDDGLVPVLLSDEVTAAILADVPSSGSLSSGTLDYFDRIVNGLPATYGYVAYRTNSDDSNDAVLYFGKNYDIEGNTVIFGSKSTKIVVDRVTSSGYSNVTNYYSSECSDVEVDILQNGSVVYYSNILDGFPVLGHNQSIGFSPFVVCALLAAMTQVLLSKLILKR